MRDLAAAELDAVMALAHRVAAAHGVLSGLSVDLGEAARAIAGSDGAWFAADMGHECRVLATRAGELADGTTRSAAAFAAADRRPPPAAPAVPGARLTGVTSRPASPRALAQPSHPAAVLQRAAGVPPARPLPDTLPADPLAALVAVARSQVGYREGRGNATVFGTWAGAPSAPWCASFVSWVFAAAGRPLPAVDVRRGFVGVKNGRDWAAAHGRSFRRPEVGDIVTTVRADGRGHVGIVVAVLPGGRIRTIEGNTNAHGGREGVVVAERVRRVTTGMRFWRP